VIVGVLGAGQLGRMLALAGYPLGVRFRFYDDAPDACAGQVGELVVGSFQDLERLDQFAAGVDVITYEFENVPVVAPEHLARRVPVFPPPGALRVCQDRLEEKQLFRKLRIETPAFEPAATRAEFDAALNRIGYPNVVKTRRLGYDGKGQAVLRMPADAEHAWVRLGEGRTQLIVEAFVPFQREVSIIAVASRAPAPNLSPALQKTAEDCAMRALDAMSYVGVLAIEFFEHQGHLLANEMAPRVHNSGHWTIDGAVTSQFENHLRAVAGLPLGSTAAIGHAGMVNLIGEAPSLESLATIEGAHIHLYGKSPRAGRKIGHVNVLAESGIARDRAISRLATAACVTTS
jgi:5-(carboxyamino)imidazole ribonucleotide synthase